MKNVLFLVAVNLAFVPAGFASGSNPKCDAAAKKAANEYFDQYIEDFREEATKNLEPGEQLNEDDLPGGLDLQSIEGSSYYFGFGERQECACGFTVKTKLNQKRTWCYGKVDVKSFSCECG